MIDMVIHMSIHIFHIMKMIIDIIKHIIQNGVKLKMVEVNFMVYLEVNLVDMINQQNIKLLKLGEMKKIMNINLGKMKLVIFMILNILLLLMLFLFLKFI